MPTRPSGRRNRRRRELRLEEERKYSVAKSGEGARQVAALACVPAADRINVLLITSRRRRRWIIPKGWPHEGHSLAHSAALEAQEEAGVHGPIHPEPVGGYDYNKQIDQTERALCSVLVYPLLVVEHRLKWREKSERRLEWHALHEASSIVDDDGLGSLMRDLAEHNGARIRGTLMELAKAGYRG